MQQKIGFKEKLINTNGGRLYNKLLFVGAEYCTIILRPLWGKNNNLENLDIGGIV
jgi:hypothetical protein